MVIIDNEFKNLIPPLAEDELKQLESNLIKEGWRDNERIIIWNDTIVDGHNRYSICKKHNINFKTEEKKFKDKNEVKIWIINNQLGRRNLNSFSRLELVNEYDEIIDSNQGKRTDLLPNGKKLNIHKEKSKIAKVGQGTKQRYDFIKNILDEKTKIKLLKGEETINKVYTDLKKKEQRENVIKEFKEAPKLNQKDKKYGIIYADPPWKYFAGGNKNQSQYYKGMTIEEIKELPIQNLAHNNCVLFIWVTFPILKEVFEVIEGWGFEYSTCGFNWIKRNKKSDSWFFGLGNWTRSNSELCLIATKGKPIRQSASVSQIIDTPIQEHSKKPDCVRDKIVELVGDIPRIELFAREKTKGWDTWGNEVK